MSQSISQPRWLLVGLLALVILLACAITAGTLLWLRDHQAGAYPGASQLSGQTDLLLLPAPHYRLNSSYRSTDTFPNIVNWYQAQLGVGEETQAQSGCSHLVGSRRRLLLTQSASVTVCETSRGRLIFVQRAARLVSPW